MEVYNVTVDESPDVYDVSVNTSPDIYNVEIVEGVSSQALNQALSVYVPYTGASSDVNLGSNNLTTTGSISALSASISGNLAVDTNTLFVDSVNNKVGVGTTSPTAKLDVNGTLNVAGASTFLGKVTASNQGALSALGNNDVLTKSLADDFRMDSGVIYLRDDFLMHNSDSGSLGELGWASVNILGANQSRPNLLNYDFGTTSLVTSTALRNSLYLYPDSTNTGGGSGTSISTFANSRFRMKYRFMIPSLDCGIRLGYAFIGAGGFKTSALFGVSYIKPSSVWKPSTVVPLNSYIEPTTPNGRRYYASVAGTTGVSEPVWNTGDRSLTPTVGSDGSVVWTEFGSAGNANFMFNCYENYQDQLTTKTDTLVPVAINTWYDAEFRWVSGSTFSLSINGSTPVTINNTTSVKINPHMVIETLVNSASNLHVDYFMLLSSVTR